MPMTLQSTRPHRTRRTVLRAGVLGAALTPALVACGQGGATSSDVGALTTVKEKAALEIWHWDGFFKDTMASLGNSFTQLNPNATVNVLQMPLGEYYGSKLPAAIASDTAPAVVGIHPLYSHSTATASFYRDLNRYIAADKSFDKSDFFDVGLKAYSWKGQQYGIPHDSAFLHFYYNQEMFQRLGIKTPIEHYREGRWSWDTYMDLANRFRRDTDGDGAIDQFGTTGENGANWTRFTTFLWQNGADVFDPGYTRSTIATPAAQEAFTWMKETQRLAPNAQERTTSNFNTGKIAFWHEWHVRGETYLKNFQYKFGVAPMIKGKQQAQMFHGGPAWAVVAAGKHPDAAWQLIRHFTTKDAFAAQLHLWMMPARKSLDTDAFWAGNKQLPPETRLAFQLAARTGRAVPRVARFREMEQALNASIGKFLRDEISVAAATQEAAREIDRLLAESGSDPIK